MQLFSSNLDSPQELLARDEALLDECESSNHPGFLTFWTSPAHFIVLGYGKKLRDEVAESSSAALNVPVLRRCSGGGTVLQGPGCLSYALVLPIDSAPELETITGANRYIMERTRGALEGFTGKPVAIQGHTDLTINGLKFSGNSQRRKRRCLLFHGTFLVGMDLDLIRKVLMEPAQRPEYRSNRNHLEFLMNLPVEPAALEECLSAAWSCTERCPADLQNRLDQQIAALARSKYSDPGWNFRA